MKEGFVSEALVLAGSYMVLNGQVSTGIACLVCGVLGGVGKFFHDVSIGSTKETRKSMMYADIKSLLMSLASTAKEFSGNDSHESKGRKGPTIH